MRINELKPGMVCSYRNDWADWGMDYDEEGKPLPPGRTVYQVPQGELTFELHGERRVRTPILNIFRITYINHDDGTVSTKVEPFKNAKYPEGRRAISGRDLNPLANSMSEAMAALGRAQTVKREREQAREDVSARCYRALEAVERLTGWRSPELNDTRWTLSRAVVDLEALEELIGLAQLYIDTRED